MADSILQIYLNAHHIKVSDETSVENLKKTISEVKKHLSKKKGQIIPFTLVALDPRVEDNDPIVEQVEKMIIKHWKTFSNSVKSTSDKSTTYVRAVILESLNQLAKKNIATAALVWLTARDVIRYYNLDSEKNAIGNLLQELANFTEEEGRTSWGVNRKAKMQEFEGADTSIPTPEPSIVDQDELKDYLLRASQHTAWRQYSNQIGDNPANFNQNWANFFSDKAAEGVSEVVNSALAKQNKSLSTTLISVKKSLDEYFAQLQPFFENLNSSLANGISANNKRSELLWWKQSLYSQSLNMSYRHLNLVNTIFAMVLDLSAQVDAVYPESVDYFLRESLKDLYEDHAEEERAFSVWFEDSADLHETIKSKLERYTTESEERLPLINAWVNALLSGGTVDILANTGIEEEATVSASDLVVWLFHGLQAQKLATIK